MTYFKNVISSYDLICKFVIIHLSPPLIETTFKTLRFLKVSESLHSGFPYVNLTLLNCVKNMLNKF